MKKAVLCFLLIAVMIAAMLPGFAETVEVDLDLSTMTTSIAYAQMVAILREPAAYVGKTLRIAGSFNYSELRQRAVIIVADKSACCETSLDFITAQDLAYPDDYPGLYKRFTVVGTLTASEEAEIGYLLADAVIEAL